MRARKVLPIAALLAVLLIGGVAFHPGRVMGLYQGGPDEGARWPGTNAQTIIPVCFRPYGTIDYDRQGHSYMVNYPYDEWLAKIALVKDTLEDTWARWTNITFTGFGQCPSNVSGYIYVDLIKEDCGGCGDSIPRGYHPEGVRVWEKMENPDERLIRSVVTHEFGHVLGFHHEMDRPDAVFPPNTPPCDRIEYTGGVYLTPYYDDVSIMNYCSPRNRNGLSAGDREGAELLYGMSAAGAWVKTLPTQAQFLDPSFSVALPALAK